MPGSVGRDVLRDSYRLCNAVDVLVYLLALAAIIKQTHGRARVNEFRVLLFAVNHAGFYPKEVFRAFDLQTDGSMNEIYRTLKQMELTGLLNSQRRGNGRIYYCSRQGRREAATLGATLIAEANELLEGMKQDRHCRQTEVVSIP